MLEKRNKEQQNKYQKKTYAEMLKELDPTASANNEDVDSHFPLDLGTRKGDAY